MISKVAVLIHGYTLLSSQYRNDQAEIGSREWNNVVWGDPEKQLLGRIPHGVLLALKYRPKKLIFGTGASCIFENIPIRRKYWESQGKPEGVKWEAQIAHDLMLESFDNNKLTQFSVLQEAINNFGGEKASKKFLKNISKIDIKSSNTEEEIAEALKYCNKKSLDALISVTNLSHTPRCVALANKKITAKRYRIFYITSPCDTDFSVNEHTLIFEPQSGPGPKNKLSPCVILESYFKLCCEKQMDFLKSAKKIFEEVGEK